MNKETSGRFDTHSFTKPDAGAPLTNDEIDTLVARINASTGRNFSFTDLGGGSGSATVSTNGGTVIGGDGNDRAAGGSGWSSVLAG